jgi:hypothetical protein
MYKLIPLFCLLILSACATQPKISDPRAVKRDLFLAALTGGKEIWSTSTPAEIRRAVEDFHARKHLPNGKIYGASVRNLDLGAHSLAKTANLMASRACRKSEDVLHDPKSGAPALCNGLKVKQIIFDCPDGGMVRLKPAGDPCSRQRTQPHGVKSVRLPFDADPRDFSHEAFKVDSTDHPLPKSPAELAPGIDADGWAEDAHADLPQ